MSQKANGACWSQPEDMIRCGIHSDADDQQLAASVKFSEETSGCRLCTMIGALDIAATARNPLLFKRSRPPPHFFRLTIVM